ncbi:zinc-binding dehydrogenase [Alkalimarinus coralli]|uniref:zinc-binding dehydrogenase n=1 Tax=Alkalimarinus coralli TaxID=2935863 RepID=UPI00211141F7|nr:zinc-binding dehydrogenase [Alkalimarinus coralli]
MISASASAECLEMFAQLRETGQLKTLIDRHFGLPALEDAYAYSRTGRARGKIIIDVKG